MISIGLLSALSGRASSGGGGGEGGSVLGTIINDSFSGSSLSADWTENTPTVALTVNNKLSFTDSPDAFGNYIEYVTRRVPYERFKIEVSFKPLNKTGGVAGNDEGGTYGIGIITDSGIDNYNTSLFTKVCLSSETGVGSSSGYHSYLNGGEFAISNAGTIADASFIDGPYQAARGTFAAWSVGDRMLYTVEADAENYELRSKIKNIETNAESTITGGTKQSHGAIRLNFYGGSIEITNFKISSNSKLNSVVFVGDSITKGAGASARQYRYANQVFSNNETKFEVVAAGSTKIAQAKAWKNDIADLQPNYVIMAHGYNDSVQNTNQTTFESDYRNCISTFQAAGSTVICLTTVPNPGGGDYSVIIRSICTDLGLKCVDIEPLLTDPTLGVYKLNPIYASSDTFHPNDDGYTVIGNKVITDCPELF